MSLYHPHRLVPMQRVYICDICHKDTANQQLLAYTCASCNFDACPRCFGGRHPHALQLSSNRNFVCDFCQVNGTGFSYHCRSCDYDECMACVTGRFPSARHTSIHRLEFVKSGNGYYCDVCRQKIIGNRFTCKPCNHNECQACFERCTLSQGSIPVVPVNPYLPVIPIIPVVNPIVNPMPVPPPYSTHAHPLYPTFRTFNCDKCRGYFANQTSYYCRLCDYDECVRCNNGPSCGVCHGRLTYENPNYYTGSFKCNRCGVTRAGSSYHCLAHQYDLCPNCYNS